MKLTFSTRGPLQTKAIGKALAEEIIKTKSKEKALVLGLRGDLGGGKTTFLQGFAQGLGIKEKILSPTFVILKRFEIKKGKGQYGFFYHIDCYRIQKAKEISALGFREISSCPRNIVAIEWADKIEGLLPQDILSINFEFIDKNTRRIHFSLS